VLTVRSSKLAVLTYFGQFSMLLLTVLGVPRRFKHSGNPGSANGEVTKTRRFDLFWPVFYAFTHSFGGSAPIRMFGQPWGPLTGRSPKPVVLAYSGQFSMVLLTVLGSHGDSKVRGTPGRAYGEVSKTRSFHLFWPICYAITHSCGGSAPIRTFRQPWVC
jgi:hypothetical protein